MSDIIARRDHPFVGNIGKLLRLRSVFTPIKHGLFYNWYAVNDSRYLAPAGWHVPSIAEFDILTTGLGGESVAGTHMKEMDASYWFNYGDYTDYFDNSSGFSARGSDYRNQSGTFAGRTSGLAGSLNRMWTATEYSTAAAYGTFMRNDYPDFHYQNDVWKQIGDSVRLIKDDSTLVPFMGGNDGKIYPTVKIGNQVWITRNLAETKYRNGDSIPEVTNDTAWSNLRLTASGALCAFRNDWNNV